MPGTSMHPLRTVTTLIGAALPVAYCAGFLWYFVDLGGWDDPVLSRELQPTIIGLGIVGLIFSLALGWKIRRMFKSSDTSGPGGGAGPDARVRPAGDEPGADPDTDAMIARYLAERAAAETPPPPERPRAAPVPGGATFGRRGRQTP